MKTSRPGHVLDYAISVLMITILVLITFMLPGIFSRYTDEKNSNQVHVAEREKFTFESPVDMAMGERVQNMMAQLGSRNNLRRTLYMSGMEISDSGLMAGIRESVNIMVQYNLMPDISGYELADNIIFAEYYNLSDNAAGAGDMAFWNLRFSDYETFDFTLRVDAAEYTIYQAELYCGEVTEYLDALTGGDEEEVKALNKQFMDGSEACFEAEGYDALTDVAGSDLVFVMGYERGQYSFYHAPCNNGTLEIQGIRWGFVPMTVALENGGAVSEWGYGGIEKYYKNRYDIEIYDRGANQ